MALGEVNNLAMNEFGKSRWI